MCRFFTTEQSANGLFESLSSRLNKLVVAAVNYHSLIQPGRTLHYKVYMGQKWQYPRLADTSTIDGSCTESAGLQPIGEFDATSTVHASSHCSPHYFVGDQPLVDRNVRYILLTPDDATDDDVQLHHPTESRKVRLYKKFETTAPIAFDYVREAMRSEREFHSKQPIPLYRPNTVERVNASGESHHPWVEVKPGPRVSGARKAVIIAMHWLQAGGAERWGMETIALAKKAGLLPIVLTDRDSHQPWITRPECEGALVLPLTQPLQERAGDAPILRALFEQFDIRGVVIHHCQWMYDNAWWVKRYFPDVPIVDSLHIVEYVMQGGYPRESVARDEWIDLHHVISPQLEHWMIDTHGIDPAKVIDAPLAGLTADTADAAALTFKARRDANRLTVAFVGRITRQKRPEAFILAAKELERARPGAFRFIMHGSGDMDAFVDKLIARHGLGEVIERRSMDIPVAETYRDADVLLISSINEGITLTTIEAICAGVPTLSADVGSQQTLIPPQGLLHRMTAPLIRDAKRSLIHVLDDEDDRRRLWQAERQRLASFCKKRSADSLFQDLFTEWSK